MSQFLLVVDGLLTPQECRDFIAHFEGQKLELIDNGVAKYERGIMKNAAWADLIHHRLRHCVPANFNTVCANDHLRFSKYEKGGEFAIHRDGINQDRHGNRSVITVNIFLNEDFTGGSTDFYHGDKKTLRESVTPRTGRAAVFDSQQYHAGRPVSTGNKYLLRTDLMQDGCGSVQQAR